MKKHLILLFLAGTLSLTSCSNDKEETSTKDPIIGTWILLDVNPSTTIFNIEECTETSTITFLSNNIATATLYTAMNNCNAQPAGGTWENMGNSTYKLTVPLMGSREIKVDFEGSGTFSINYMEAQLTFKRK